MGKKISEIAFLWREYKRSYVKRSSLSAYTLLIENHILPNFGEKYGIEESDVQGFVLRKIEDGLSQKTIKDVLIVLKMILRFGAKNKWVVYEPFDDIQFPTRRGQKSIEVLTKVNQRKIMNYIRENFTFRNLGIYICLSTGMRIGEICGLTWGDIDMEDGVIRVNRTIQRIYVIEDGIRKTELIIDTPKTINSNREIPMSRDLLRMLKPLKKVVNPLYFVLTNEAKPTEPRVYREYYKNLMIALNIPVLKFHGLRHSFATRCIESKCDYKTVSSLLGHSNISTTLNLYVHPNLEQKQLAIDQMFKALG